MRTSSSGNNLHTADEVRQSCSPPPGLAALQRCVCATSIDSEQASTKHHVAAKSDLLPCAEVYVRDGLGYDDEPDDLKVNLGEHLLRAVFSRAASNAWVSQGPSPAQ